MQTNSVTDTQQARLDGTRDQGENDEDKVSKVDGSNKKRRGGEDAVDAPDTSVQLQAAAQVDRPQVSESVHVPNKRAKTSETAVAPAVDEEAVPASEAEPAASAAPPAHVGGGFGGLASKGASGFAFGGTSTFGSGGFGSVAFGGTTFGSSAVGANSFTTKASKDKPDDRGSPSVASNAGSVQPFGAFASTAEARGAVPVFGTASAVEGEAAQLSKEKPVTGEEDEETVWTCKAALYQFDKEAARPVWRERGTGSLRINVGPDKKARIVMRQLGNLKLLLNASLFPAIKLERTEGLPRVSFCCAHSAELSTRDGGEVGEPDTAAAVAVEEGEQAAGQKMTMYALKMGSIEKVDAFVEHVDRLKVQGHASEGGMAAAAACGQAVPAVTAVGSVVNGSKGPVAVDDIVAGDATAARQCVVAGSLSNGEEMGSREGGVVTGDGIGSAEVEAGAAAAAAAAAACAVDFATH